MKTASTASDIGETDASMIPCPFVYAGGKRCKGHVVAIEAFRVDLRWNKTPQGWTFNRGQPRSHYHVYCSEKGNHAGHARDDSSQLKLHPSEMSPELLKLIS